MTRLSEWDLRDKAKDITTIINATLVVGNETKDCLYHEVDEILDNLNIEEIKKIEHMMQEAKANNENNYWTITAMVLIQEHITALEEEEKEEVNVKLEKIYLKDLEITIDVKEEADPFATNMVGIITKINGDIVEDFLTYFTGKSVEEIKKIELERFKKLIEPILEIFNNNTPQTLSFSNEIVVKLWRIFKKISKEKEAK